MLLLKALNGEIEMDDRHFTNATNKPVLTDNQQKGQYHFFTETPDSMNTFIVLFNFNHKDPVMRKIIQNEDFRIGLSHAIDRKAIIDTVYVSQGTPWQAAPLSSRRTTTSSWRRSIWNMTQPRRTSMLDRWGRRRGRWDPAAPRWQATQMVFEVNSTSDRLD